MLGKAGFEKIAATHGVHVEAYHTENGRFSELGFHEAVVEAYLTINFCGVEAHHQNGIMKRYIQDAKQYGQTTVAHKKTRPQEIGTIL